MKNFSTVMAILIGTLVLSGVALADKRIASPGVGQNCRVEETATVSLNFTGTETDITKVKTLVEGRLEEIKAIAKEVGADSVDMQNYSYNTYNNNASSDRCGGSPAAPASFQYSGNLSLTIKPGDKAAALAAALSAKGMNASLNVNAYRQCQGSE